MADKEDRRRRVRRVRKAPGSPDVKPPKVEIEAQPQEPIIETIPAVPVPESDERGKLVILDNVLMDIVEKIVDKGKAVVISRGRGSDFLIHAEDESEFSIGRAATWDEYNKTVLTPEYLEWTVKWDKMTMEEKLEFAEEMKATWEEHKEPRINSMRMAQAVRESLSIQKYLDNYNTRSARRAIRPRR